MIGVSTSSDHVLLTTSHICLDVVAIGQGLPLVEVVDLSRLLLGPNEDAHLVLPVLVAAPARHARLREVHDLNGVGLALDASLRAEVEPLLVPARVRIDLHEEVVGVRFEGVALCLEQIARLEHGIKEEQLVAMLALQTGLAVLVGNEELEQLAGEILVFAGAEWRHLRGVVARRLVLLLQLLAHYHQLVLLQLKRVAGLITFVDEYLLRFLVRRIMHKHLLSELLLEVRQEVVLIQYFCKLIDLPARVVKYYIEFGDVVVAYFAFPVGDLLVVLAVILALQFFKCAAVEVLLAYSNFLEQIVLLGVHVRYPPDQGQGLGDVPDLLLDRLVHIHVDEAHDLGDALALEVGLSVIPLLALEGIGTDTQVSG